MRTLWLLLASTAFAQDWSGRWEGELVNYPRRESVAPVPIVREIGEMPRANGDCSTFKTTYSPPGQKIVVKDYRLCRGSGASEYFIDEGQGLKLKAQLLGDTLVSTFKYQRVLLISVMRLRGDLLEEDIYTAADQPATDGVLSLDTRSLQRLQFRRARP
ncbi:MAG: hypothetical protein K2Q23_09635 [Bryobacteraceae bacterium]|nr:hypothetical protein [Bryobacteraceae bacterium]